MNIYILRHGIAIEPGTVGYENDADRPLISKGERRLRSAAAAMQKMELSFDVIFSSPLVRARQTAEIIAEELKLKKRLQLADALAPGGSMKNLIRQLKDLQPSPENVLLVGHEPSLSRLIALLATGNAGATIEMKKGGLCKLETEELEFGHCATLVWLLIPSQMELMT